jgi:hypothetical protein
VRFRGEGRAIAMIAHVKDWKTTIDRLWSASPLDYAQAARVSAEIARSEVPTLQQTASQALPALRHACLRSADRSTKAIAHRRLGAIRDALHALDAPRFGKRGHLALTPDDHHRRLLGLPQGRSLSATEIRDAYKRAAKTLHPDCGGDAREFNELSVARDALLKDA